MSSRATVKILILPTTYLMPVLYLDGTSLTMSTPTTLLMNAANDGGSLKVVADSVGVAPEALEDLVLETPYFGMGTQRILRTFQPPARTPSVWQGLAVSSRSIPPDRAGREGEVLRT